MKHKNLLIILLILVLFSFNIKDVNADNAKNLCENRPLYRNIDYDMNDYVGACGYEGKIENWAGVYDYTVILYVPKEGNNVPLMRFQEDFTGSGIGSYLFEDYKESYEFSTEINDIERHVNFDYFGAFNFGTGMGIQAFTLDIHNNVGTWYGACPEKIYMNQPIIDFHTTGRPLLDTWDFVTNLFEYLVQLVTEGEQINIKHYAEDSHNYTEELELVATFNPNTCENIDELEPPEPEPEPIEVNCDTLITSEMKDIINKILTYVKILVPILVIALGMVDFSKAVLGSKEEDMKKAQSKFVRRLIIAVLIFLLPTLINLILDLANMAWNGTKFGNSNCGL